MMSDSSGSTPKTLTCPTCGYLMEVKYLGDLKDKKAVCPACNTKVDMDDSFARTHKRITRKKGLFGSEEIEEIISEERSDFKPPAAQAPAQTPPPQSPFGQPYVAKQNPPYQQQGGFQPGQQVPHVVVTGGTYTYKPGAAKTSASGGTSAIGCIITMFILVAVFGVVGFAIYAGIQSANEASNSSNNLQTEIASTSQAALAQAGIFISTSTPGGSGGGGFQFQSWKILNGHTREVNQVAFSPDGLHMASTSSDDTLRLWDISTGETIAEITGVTFEEPSLVAFSPDGNLMATASDSSGKVKLYNPATGDFIRQIQSSESNVNGLAFSPDSSQIAVSDYAGVTLLNVANGSQALKTPESTSTERPNYQKVLFSPDGNFVYAMSYQAVYVWDLTANEISLLLGGENATSYTDFTIMPDGKKLIMAGSGSEGVQVVDLSNGRIDQSLSGGLGGGADSVAISPDGKFLATGSFFGDFQIYDIATGTLVLKATEDLARVNSISFSPNGNVIVIGTGDEELRIFLMGDSVDPFEGVTVTQGGAGGDTVAFASPTPLAVVGCVISSRDTVNLRGGPGTDYVARGSLRPGQTREADGQAQGSGNQTWWRLVDGTWVRSDIVDEEGNCTNLPVVTP